MRENVLCYTLKQRVMWRVGRKRIIKVEFENKGNSILKREEIY